MLFGQFLISVIILVSGVLTVPSHPKTAFENALAKWQKPMNLLNSATSSVATNAANKDHQATGCVCGVFLSGQFTRGTPPTGNPALLHEHDLLFPCSITGNKQCINKCLETIIKHLPNSSTIVCGTLDRDCHKERAHLFIQNCNSTWVNTNLSAGREYCCKDGVSYKCPLV